MTRSAPKGRRFLTLRFSMLVLALVSLLTLTATLATKGQGKAQLGVARGVVDGSFHPIAGKFVPDTTNLDDCDAADRRCVEQGFGNLAYSEGPKAALALFDRRRVTERTVTTDCHRIAHIIGSASLLYFKGNVAQTYAHGSPSCTSGYYHGILERAFTNVFTTRGLVRVARSLCRDAGVRRRGFLDYQCDHGLGHGLMIQTGYDLPTALAVCRGLQTRWDEVSCAGGAFMENGSTVYGMRSQWLKSDDPIYPCRAIKLRNRASCFLRVTTQILRVDQVRLRENSANVSLARAEMAPLLLPLLWARCGACRGWEGRADPPALSACRLRGRAMPLRSRPNDRRSRWEHRPGGGALPGRGSSATGRLLRGSRSRRRPLATDR